MECPKCKSDNREGVKFCEECGANFELECPVCRAIIPLGRKYCGKCGNSLIVSPENLPHIKYSEPQSYTPKFLADKILKTRSSIEGERKLVTVLFADVANYTSMSEKLDPENVHQVMDGCFKILMNEIHEHKGMINQFTGDGVMALFGAPFALEDHAQDACSASLSIQKAIKRYSIELETKYGLIFQMRIGINSGTVVVGSIGDDLRMDYTAIGDTTNLAARLESMAQPETVLVSSNTYKMVSQQFDLKYLGRTEIKGKEKPVELYKLIKDKVYRPRLGQERQIYSEMVGRDTYLNRLELQVNKAVNGEGSVVNVIGEAGIGKSRLIAELKNSNVMKRVTFLEGRAISIGNNLSFHPIIDLLKHWSRISEDDSELTALGKLETAVRNVSQQDVGEIVPFVATLMGMKLAGRYAERVKGIEGEGLEKLILKSVKDLIKKAVVLTPLVIVIEDLHWADTSSIELLESLIRMAETQRILFINIFRPDHKETSERIIKTIKYNLPVYYVEINLEPLTEEMSEILVDNMLNIKGLHHGIKSKIVQRAGGNPYFVEEVVRSLIDEGAVIVKDGIFKVTNKIDTMVIPHTIRDVLMARIDQLEKETRELVTIASVIGRNFLYRILTKVAKTVEGIDRKLSHLTELQVIRERKLTEELEYLFKHALAQEVVYESILHQKRKDIHLQVAQSIENVFTRRLHEFYGMLALHYSKGEDYEKAEHFLLKAGEEALRSSASSEALNYYQEGLRLYLKSSKNTPDPEKLATLEKHIALALDNKSRWIESVEHIDKVFEYWNIDTSPSRVIVLLEFTKNIIFILIGKGRLFEKEKPSPTQREKEIFDLLIRLCTALVHNDNIRFIFVTLFAFNKALKIDMTKSPEAIFVFMALPPILAMSGILFKLSNKLIALSKNKIDMKNIQNVMAFNFVSTITYLSTGDWRKINNYEEAIVVEALKKGELFNTINYIWALSYIKTQKGDLLEIECYIDKLFEIADNYDYGGASINAICLKVVLLLCRFQLFEAQIEIERGIKLSIQYSDEMNQLLLIGFRAEAKILLNDLVEAKKSVIEAKKIVDKQNFILAYFIAPYLISLFMLDIQLLKHAMVSKEEPNLSSLQKRANRSGKTAFRKLKNFAPYQTKYLRLMGEYFWLIGKQRKAIKFWEKAVKRGNELGARPDLSRTYFQIGKSLVEPKSKYSQINGIDAKGYLEMAKNLFEEMDLQWNLDELDKIASDG